MNRNEIENIIPHREPYMFLDEVKVEKEGISGKAYKKLTGNEYFFEGHFPDRPVMPGVLIIEAISQAAMVISGRSDLKLRIGIFGGSICGKQFGCFRRDNTGSGFSLIYLKASKFPDIIRNL
jgi:3-hydroxyacyl-[acyl-carrier-protein] dehydratase